MASAIEQLSRNASWSAFSKATELKQRILFVIGALLVYRLGTYIPVPGIDPAVWQQIYNSHGGGLLDMFNMFSGGAIQRMTIFALNIWPYISASIIIQLATAMSPKLEAMKKEGEAGRQKVNQYTRCLTVLLAAVQAYGMAVGLERFSGPTGSAVIDPGMFFRISTVITVVGGVIFLMWLGEQITARGVGNGISLLIYAGIVAGLPGAIAQFLELGRQGQFSIVVMITIIALVIGIIAFVVFMERAQRRLLVQYPKRTVGNQMMMGANNHLPLKLNMAGVMPAIFASALLFMPLTIINFAGGGTGEFGSAMARYLQHGQPVFMVLYAILIVFFCFFYTAIQFNPEEQAENLRKSGGFIPGIRPGKPTAEYLDHVMTRITLVGAGYLALVCLFPEFLVAEFAVPFGFGAGTSLLIVVSVTMDTVSHIQSHMVAHQYESLMKKTKLRGGISPGMMR